MEVRCHLCGAGLDARNTVRRELVVSRTGHLKQIGTVDLCQSCVQASEEKFREVEEEKELFKRPPPAGKLWRFFDWSFPILGPIWIAGGLLLLCGFFYLVYLILRHFNIVPSS